MAMELFRPTGQLTWQVRFTDHQGYRRQVSARTRTRSTASTIGHHLEELAEHRKGNREIGPHLVQWIAVCHKDIREKLSAWGIISTQTAESGRRLYNHPRPKPLPADWIDPPPAMIDLWAEELEEKQKSDGYCQKSRNKLMTLFSLEVPNNPPIEHWRDLKPAAIEARIKGLRKTPPASANRDRLGGRRKECSPQTCNDYLVAAKQFCGWVVGKGWAHENPLKGMAPTYSAEVVRSEQKHPRRALSVPEQITLVSQTETLPDRWNMTGHERAILYRFALGTGLRAKECYALKARNLNFFAKTITLLAADTKARRGAELPLRDELVEPLRELCKGKHPEAEVFPRLYPGNYCRMLKDDLDVLGIPYKDDLGRFADFHSLRHTFGTELAKVVMPAAHMRLMRHRDIKTTMEFYVHTELAEQADALAKLPSLSPTKKNTERAG